MMKIRDNFMVFTKEEMTELARGIGLRGYSKLKKAELAERMEEFLLSDEYLDRFFMTVEDNTIKLLMRVVNGGTPDDEDFAEAIILMMQGYAAADQNDGFILCDGVADAVKRCYTKERKAKRKRISNVSRHCDVFAKLYGAIPIEEALKIYNSLNPCLSYDKFVSILEEAEPYSNSWTIFMGEIIDESDELTDAYDVLVRQRKNKQYYIPDKQEFESYMDGTYRDYLPGYCDIYDMLTEELGAPDFEAELLCRDIEYMIRWGFRLDDITKELEEHDVYFETKLQVERFFSLIMELTNNTRMPFNLGHTPWELSKAYSDTRKPKKKSSAKSRANLKLYVPESD